MVHITSPDTPTGQGKHLTGDTQRLQYGDWIAEGKYKAINKQNTATNQGAIQKDVPS